MFLLFKCLKTSNSQSASVPGFEMLNQTCVFFVFNSYKQRLVLEGRGRSVCPVEGCLCSSGGLGTYLAGVRVRPMALLLSG